MTWVEIYIIMTMYDLKGAGMGMYIFHVYHNSGHLLFDLFAETHYSGCECAGTVEWAGADLVLGITGMVIVEAEAMLCLQ